MFHRSFQRIAGKTALNPQTVSGSSAVNGNIIDRLGSTGGLLTLQYGATANTPTGTQLAVIVQHGDAANLSDAATYVTVASLGTTSTNFTAGDAANYDINFEGAKRYVRVVVTPTFTGGSSPNILLAASLGLEDKDVEPTGQSVIALP